MPARRLLANVSKLEKTLIPGHVLIRLTWTDGHAAPVLCAGHHLKVFAPNVKGEIEGQWCGKPDSEDTYIEISRRYTPVACTDAWFDLVVELITKERAPPDGGKFSRFIAGMAVGEQVTVSGPHGVYRYLGSRRFERGTGTGQIETVEASDVVLVAGGVVANTALALATAIAQQPTEAAPRLWIVVAARTRDVVLHRLELEALATQNPDRVRLWFTIEKGAPPEDWLYGAGSLAEALTAERLPPSRPGVLVVSMGSLRTKQACQEKLPLLGHESTPLWHWNEVLD